MEPEPVPEDETGQQNIGTARDKKKPGKLAKKMRALNIACAAKKLPLIDKLLIGQSQFIMNTLPGRIVLNISDYIDKLAKGHKPPKPKEVAKAFLAKLKGRLRKKPIAPEGALPGTSTGGLPPIGEEAKGKLPPLEIDAKLP
eukprot:SAG31_NODE_5096_length_2747_cov_1.421073_2_plen_142_part_00